MLARGAATISPDARALIARDADALSVFRDGASRACATLELGGARAVSFSDDGVTFAVASPTTGDVVVYDTSARVIVRHWRGVDARDVAFAPSSSEQVVLHLKRDGAVVVGDARSGELITLGVVNVKLDVSRSIAYSPCGRWMAVLSRDARARDGVDVFSRRGEVSGAISFVSKSSDARAIEWTTTFNGDYVLMYDDGYEVDAVPTLVVHRSDGALRATFRNVLPHVRARTKTSLIVHSSNDGLMWINETRWEITRCVHNPFRLNPTVSTSTRVYRESGASYEKLAKYEASTLTDAVGGDVAVSPCETMLASTCASRAHVLFLWSAASCAPSNGSTDDDPLAIFVHDNEVTSLKWVADDRVAGGSKLVFICAGKSRVYTWIPGAVAPTSMTLPQSFIPHIIEGVYAGKVILATRARSAFMTCDLAPN